MGTRGITEVIFENKIVVSQYGQWDHYPSGQGATILKFLSKPTNIDKLKNNLNLHLTYEASDEELKKIYANYFNEDGMGTADDGKRFNEDYPSLTRDTGGEILEVIANATEPIPLVLDKEFKNDDLFCEGIYTINLDDETFTTEFGGETLTLSFDQVREISYEDYCGAAKCGVYEYHKQSQAV